MKKIDKVCTDTLHEDIKSNVCDDVVGTWICVWHVVCSHVTSLHNLCICSVWTVLKEILFWDAQISIIDIFGTRRDTIYVLNFENSYLAVEVSVLWRKHKSASSSHFMHHAITKTVFSTFAYLTTNPMLQQLWTLSRHRHNLWHSNSQRVYWMAKLSQR